MALSDRGLERRPTGVPAPAVPTEQPLAQEQSAWDHVVMRHSPELPRRSPASTRAAPTTVSPMPVPALIIDRPVHLVRGTPARPSERSATALRPARWQPTGGLAMPRSPRRC